jgi:hypothetical protein
MYWAYILELISKQRQKHKGPVIFEVFMTVRMMMMMMFFWVLAPCRLISRCW